MMSLYGKSVLASSSMPLRTKRKLLTCILIRRATLIFANFGLFCLLLPLATLVPEARVPLWAVYGVPLLNGLLFWFALPRWVKMRLNLVGTLESKGPLEKRNPGISVIHVSSYIA